MKKRNLCAVLIIAISAFLIVSCGNENSAGEKAAENMTSPAATAKAEKSKLYTILKSGRMRVGTPGDYNPMTFRDPESGEYVGYYIDVVKALAKDMGVEIEWVATDWKSLVSGVMADKFDITTGASYNMGRAKSAAYTLPINSVGTVPLMLKKNAGRFDSWESINQKGITVAVTLGTVFDEQARVLFPNAEIKAVDPPAREYQEVLAGRADVSITSNIEGSQLVKTYPDLRVVPVDAPKYQNLNGMLIQQDDQIFLNYLNVWLAMKEKQGVLEALRNKWISLD
jgi:cyclohexadienyl dehydratase